MLKFNVGDRVKYVGSNGYYNPKRLGKFGVVRDRFDDISVNITSESGDVWCGVYDANLELVKSAEDKSPIRTVTRREIVPGQYGYIEISDVNNEGVSLWLPRNQRWSSEKLREAAYVLNQLAEVLEDE